MLIDPQLQSAAFWRENTREETVNISISLAK